MNKANSNDQLKTVLITGGSGLVGKELSQLLSHQGHNVIHLSRKPVNGLFKTFHWDIKSGEVASEAIMSASAIIHLAGAGVADKRWNAQRKKEIYDSRIDSTRLLRSKVEKLNPNLAYFLSASAIGYYGWDTTDETVDESSPKGEGFLADVVEGWEKEVSGFDEIGVKNGKLRMGIVLSNKGGSLPAIAKPIRLLAGASLGSGDQYMNWIHISDLCRIFSFMLERQITSVVNAVAPHPETNSAFTKKLASHLKKPLWLPNVPKFALRLMVGEMADMIIGGSKVSGRLIEEKGYNFQFRTLEEALEDLLISKK
ncbi:MAG: TIGR01777 family protein [Ekhidna sp.]|nr:TIGR01777 family protein [Ekhidna sp.]MBC6411211.1 TIGR01777 family protein [Ekhidna sp.]